MVRVVRQQGQVVHRQHVDMAAGRAAVVLQVLDDLCTQQYH